VPIRAVTGTAGRERCRVRDEALIWALALQ
jgi:hypothetical protein